MKQCLDRYIHFVLLLFVMFLFGCTQESTRARLSAEQINALHSQWHQFEQAGRIGELDINEISRWASIRVSTCRFIRYIFEGVEVAISV